MQVLAFRRLPPPQRVQRRRGDRRPAAAGGSVRGGAEHLRGDGCRRQTLAHLTKEAHSTAAGGELPSSCTRSAWICHFHQLMSTTSGFGPQPSV